MYGDDKYPKDIVRSAHFAASHIGFGEDPLDYAALLMEERRRCADLVYTVWHIATGDDAIRGEKRAMLSELEDQILEGSRPLWQRLDDEEVHDEREWGEAYRQMIEANTAADVRLAEWGKEDADT